LCTKDSYGFGNFLNIDKTTIEKLCWKTERISFKIEEDELIPLTEKVITSVCSDIHERFTTVKKENMVQT
jgi:hypothetical protein